MFYDVTIFLLFLQHTTKYKIQHQGALVRWGQTWNWNESVLIICIILKLKNTNKLLKHYVWQGFKYYNL